MLRKSLPNSKLTLPLVWKRKIENSQGSKKGGKGVTQAVEALRRGEVVVFPTETLYGLGADALNPAAVAQVVAVKGRDERSPIPIIVADREMLGTVVAEVPEVAQKWIEQFWPGPLTLVLKGRGGLPGPLLNPRGGVGVRVSSHPVASELVRKLGRPITATSANPSGKKPARTLDQARAYFAGILEVFLNGEELFGKIGSTVVEIDGNRWRVIREGEISSKVLRESLS